MKQGRHFFIVLVLSIATVFAGSSANNNVRQRVNSLDLNFDSAVKMGREEFAAVVMDSFSCGREDVASRFWPVIHEMASKLQELEERNVKNSDFFELKNKRDLLEVTLRVQYLQARDLEARKELWSVYPSPLNWKAYDAAQGELHAVMDSLDEARARFDHHYRYLIKKGMTPAESVSSVADWLRAKMQSCSKK